MTAHTFNRKGEVVPDYRTISPEFEDANNSGWQATKYDSRGRVVRQGHAIYAPRKSSPARLRFKAARAARRHPGDVMKQIAAAS